MMADRHHVTRLGRGCPAHVCASEAATARCSSPVNLHPYWNLQQVTQRYILSRFFSCSAHLTYVWFNWCAKHARSW